MCSLGEEDMLSIAILATRILIEVALYLPWSINFPSSIYFIAPLFHKYQSFSFTVSTSHPCNVTTILLQSDLQIIQPALASCAIPRLMIFA